MIGATSVHLAGNRCALAPAKGGFSLFPLGAAERPPSLSGKLVIQGGGGALFSPLPSSSPHLTPRVKWVT